MGEKNERAPKCMLEIYLLKVSPFAERAMNTLYKLCINESVQ